MTTLNASTPKLLDIIQASETLNIKVSRLRSAVFNREIPFIKIGRLVRFDINDLHKWIEILKEKQKESNEVLLDYRFS